MRYPALLLLLLVFACVQARGQGRDLAVEAWKSTRGAEVVLTRILIEGNKVTRASVILRELRIYEGQMVRRDSIEALEQENKLRLFNLQLFNEVAQEVEISGDSVIWHIKLKERWFIIPSAIVQFADRNINTWWVDQNHDLRRVSAGLTVTDKNFRGNLETLAITVQAGYTQKLGINYMRPYVNKDQTHGIGFWAIAAQSRQAYYATLADKLAFAGGYSGPVIWQQQEGGLSYLYRPGYAHKHILQLGYRQFSVGDTIVKLNPDYYASGSRRARFIELNYRYEYNGVDNWNYSLKGVKLVATAIARTGFEGIKQQAFVNVEAGIFRNPLPRWYVSLIGRGRLMYPQDQPYYFRGGLGTQTDYVRGYEYFVTDGYNYGVLRFDLKRELFNNTYSIPVRYFTAIPLRIYPKLFFDAGYNSSPVRGINTLSNQLLYSFGAGVDIVTLYDVKIRVEFARNHLGQNGVYLHFNSE
jgi:outer membrane protein assembly factor BamA